MNQFMHRRVSVLLAAFLILAGWSAPGWAVTAHVSWNPNGESDLAGYIVCRGTIALDYNEGCVNIGNTVNYDAAGLLEGVTYYFAVKAVDSAGNQSTLSQEVAFVSGDLPVVVGPTDNILVAPGTSTIEKGGVQQYSAVAKDGQGIQLNDVIFQWNSSNPAVASVNASGVATGLAPGTAKITAESDGIISNQVSLLVEGLEDTSTAVIEIQPAAPSIEQGATQQFTASAKDGQGAVKSGVLFSWFSDNPSVATVNGSGLVQGVAPGIAKITASGDGVTSNQASLSVAAVPEEEDSDIASMVIVVNPGSGSIEAGGTLKFNAVASDADGAPIEGMAFVWKSTNSIAASINVSGTATGVSPGTTGITASIGDIISNEAFLSVTGTGGSAESDPETSAGSTSIDSVFVDPKTITISIGSNQQYSAVVKDDQGAQVNQPVLSWNSSNPQVVSVDETGVATGFSKGKATITASAGAVLSNKSTLVVRAAQQSSSVSGGCGFVRMKGGRPPDIRQIGMNVVVFFAPLVLTSLFKGAMRVRQMTREQLGDMFGVWNTMRVAAVSLSVLMVAVMSSEVFTVFSQAV